MLMMETNRDGETQGSSGGDGQFQRSSDEFLGIWGEWFWPATYLAGDLDELEREYAGRASY